MLVVVVHPALRDPAIPRMKHKGLQAAKTAPLPFALRDVQPHRMLVAGYNIMQGDPEGTARPLPELPEKGEHLVDALVVTRDRVAAGLMEDCSIGEHLSEGVYVSSGEGVIESANRLFVGMCHGRYLLSRVTS
jgi:hypothetical protein